MRDRALDAGDAEEVLLGLLDALGDGGRHFLGLAVADAHGAVTVTDDDECGEAEATTTLDDLGDTVDVHQLVDELVVALFAIATASTLVIPLTFTRHIRFLT